MRAVWSLISYVLSGVLLVGVAVYVGFYHPYYHLPWRWIELGIMTSGVFGVVVNAYWASRKSIKLWLVLSGFLLLHLLILGFPLQLYPDKWPIVAKGFSFGLETTLLVAAVYFILDFVPYSEHRVRRKAL